MSATRIIRIWMPDGFVSAKAAPTPTPGLMVNEDPAIPGCWNITHLASGTAVATHFEDPEYALHLAVQLGPVWDWTMSGAELLKVMPTLRQKFQRVLEEAGALRHWPTGYGVPHDRVAAMEPLS